MIRSMTRNEIPPIKNLDDMAFIYKTMRWTVHQLRIVDMEPREEKQLAISLTKAHCDGSDDLIRQWTQAQEQLSTKAPIETRVQWALNIEPEIG